MSIYDIQVKNIQGETQALNDYRGKVLLLVNVASKCGLTPQYEGLEALYKAEAANGLEVLGFPCNQFLGQEPGSEDEILQFCSLTYDVTFPMFAKLEVNGPGRHPLYQQLIAAQPKAVAGGALKEKLAAKDLLPANDSDIMWNFEKFLIGKDGTVLARFAPDLQVTDAVVADAIQRALQA
ncbi:glutathione peroxidase [Thalassolituus sp. ST750PaO-4]|uniref:glutathione peroxidase n=1 Tax=Thalassolituus sp. ST750PaO-4 TaxID=2742965 RepID=UPI001CE32D25|nr:glutathione peroxidase [Thalassolituus sp. ST750PaO-4]MCA6059784.1 glutathione peroxidase [Thalassolituus sp. ST750PaO-4]